MPKFRVICKTLYWCDEVYTVEAESEDNITEDLLLSEGNLLISEQDVLDHLDITDINEIIENED